VEKKQTPIFKKKTKNFFVKMESSAPHSKKRHARSEPVDAPAAKRPKTEQAPEPKRSSVDILLGRGLNEE